MTLTIEEIDKIRINPEGYRSADVIRESTACFDGSQYPHHGFADFDIEHHARAQHFHSEYRAMQDAISSLSRCGDRNVLRTETRAIVHIR